MAATEAAAPPRTPLLFDAVPQLAKRVPWCGLGLQHSAVQPLEVLGRAIGHSSLWIKRDDQISSVYGGSKARKLEFLLAEAVERGSDEVIAVGTTASHQCVSNAAFCPGLGLRAVSFVAAQPLTPAVRRNLLLNRYFGAEVVAAPDYEVLAALVGERLKANRRAYFTAPGGGTPLGTLGFVEAALELALQVERGLLPRPDRIFIAGGSTGSAAGLALGLRLAGLDTEVHLVQVSDPAFCSEEILAGLERDTATLLRERIPELKPTQALRPPTFDTSVHAPGYAVPTQVALDALRLTRELEGIELDLCYTAKVMAALRAYVKAGGDAAQRESILFWHTANGRDFSSELCGIDYRQLPSGVHPAFEDPLPSFGLGADYRRECENA
ncbi:MAG: pyridoxal-phosphate dependent enzyme [Proteobacteria bacterium]|nr:pyridoxal-phosphate dependent enzyme [Pseudomonadota bacterium]